MSPSAATPSVSPPTTPRLQAREQAQGVIPVSPELVQNYKESESWAWASTRSRTLYEPDALLSAKCPSEVDGVEFADWREFLKQDVTDEAILAKLQMHERTDRPLGSESFLKRLSRRLTSRLRHRR